MLASLVAWFLPGWILRNLFGKIDFAFIFHPRDAKDIGRKFPMTAYLPERLVVRVFHRLWPIPVSPICLKIADGKYLRGWQIAVPSTAALLLKNRKRARKQILAAIRLAERSEERR